MRIETRKPKKTGFAGVCKLDGEKKEKKMRFFHNFWGGGDVMNEKRTIPSRGRKWVIWLWENECRGKPVLRVKRVEGMKRVGSKVDE